MNRILGTIVISFLFEGLSVAQSYHWQTQIQDSVKADGFYTIVLQPEIGAKLQDNYADLRIWDQKNEEVPFIQKSEEPYFSTERFKEYPIITNEIVDKCCTKLVIKNSDKKPINNICFVLKNADAVKVYQIAGSDDGVNWFAIKQFDVFYNSYSETDTKVVSYINFPLTDYLYYRFDITDRGYWDEARWIYWNETRWSYPVNILKVGYYETYLEEGKYNTVPAPIFQQTDSTSDKKTYIKVSFKEDYFINRLRFKITGPRFYKRQVIIARKVEDKQKRFIAYLPITTLELNSYSLNEFDFSFFREKEFYLIIDNDDNRPLKIEAIEAWQLTRYIKAYLEKGEKYKLVYGDSIASAPVYDLHFFVDSIPEILPTLMVGKIDLLLETKVQTNERSLNWYENKILVWAAIILLILLLSFMSWKMLHEMKSKQEQN